MSLEGFFAITLVFRYLHRLWNSDYFKIKMLKPTYLNNLNIILYSHDVFGIMYLMHQMVGFTEQSGKSFLESDWNKGGTSHFYMSIFTALFQHACDSDRWYCRMRALISICMNWTIHQVSFIIWSIVIFSKILQECQSRKILDRSFKQENNFK